MYIYIYTHRVLFMRMHAIVPLQDLLFPLNPLVFNGVQPACSRNPMQRAHQDWLGSFPTQTPHFAGEAWQLQLCPDKTYGVCVCVRALLLVVLCGQESSRRRVPRYQRLLEESHPFTS